MTTPQDLAKARRIHNARHAKALAIATVAEPLVRAAGGDVDQLVRMTDAEWTRLARLVGKAGRDGRSAPSVETRAIVVDLVEQRIKPTETL